ncbi:MAG: amidohydrolase family protein, partial [Pseudomonadota bacterium]
MPDQILLLGQTLQFETDPFLTPPEEAVRYDRRGAVLIQGDRIAAVGSADDLRRDLPGQKVVDYGEGLILPGFVDAHTHYPQTAIIASWGKRLIDWLNTFTFPEEMRFSDPDYARQVANRYLDLVLAHGTTTVASFCTVHSASVDAFFQAAAMRHMAVVA